MRLNKLVLHLYNFQKEKGCRSPLDDFICNVNPIVLSTCMRHIYVFDQSQLEGQQDVLNKLLTFLETPREYQTKIEYDYLSGIEAYSFLLLWSIGALNKNKPLDDHRVLDSIRKVCLEYERSSSGKKKMTYQVNKKFLNAFLLDAKRMHQALLDNLDILKEESQGETAPIIKKFKHASKQCAQMRDNDFLDNLPVFNYSYFLLEESELFLKIQQNLEEVKDNLQVELSGNHPKKEKKALSFFSNSLEAEKTKREKIKIKISNLDTLILKAKSSLANDADNSSSLPFKSTNDLKTISLN
ncbi:hypothetical protein ACQUW5_12390 [Legionella sp. CNM-1927-20]|uniref:hypothetical protein n=1 Tax=Legionella sp. CNM-1927-20 TaxID=3422221 RepID=UPI00403A916A